MKKLIPYLIINDKCEQALNFYKQCFGGEVKFLQKYAETDYDVTPDFKGKVAHAEFISDQIHFYASDGFEGEKAKVGNNIAMSVNFSNEAEQKSIFENLRVDGKVTMNFVETPANSTLATLIDKFGIHWYLNFEKNE